MELKKGCVLGRGENEDRFEGIDGEEGGDNYGRRHNVWMEDCLGAVDKWDKIGSGVLTVSKCSSIAALRRVSDSNCERRS